MIVGFGFGDPLMALLMLVGTSLVSVLLWRGLSRPRRPRNLGDKRAALRAYYLEQRELARRMAREFDVSDEEIEARIDREVND